MKNILKILALWIVVFVAQAREEVDSVARKPKDSVWVRPSFVLSLDSRSALIKEQKFNIKGIYSGIVFGKKRHKATIGYYWMSENAYLKLINLNKNAAKKINLDNYLKTDMFFFSLMFRRNLINNKTFLVGVPLEIGIGAAKSKNVTLLDEIQLWKRKSFFVPVQTGIFLGWKATRWLGFSFQSGYRYAIFQRQVPKSYNGLYYSVGTNIRVEFFKDLYHFVFKPKSTLKK